VYMSTHRKIEWSLFILGVLGVAAAVWFGTALTPTLLFAGITLFAGLHVFHLYDGHKANHVVIVGSLALIVYSVYALATGASTGLPAYLTLGLAVLLSLLSLRLRRDFHQK
jgi:hypothetical protein